MSPIVDLFSKAPSKRYGTFAAGNLCRPNLRFDTGRRARVTVSLSGAIQRAGQATAVFAFFCDLDKAARVEVAQTVGFLIANATSSRGEKEIEKILSVSENEGSALAARNQWLCVVPAKDDLIKGRRGRLHSQNFYMGPAWHIRQA